MSPGGVIKEIKLTATGERQEFICQLLDRSATHAVVLYKTKDLRRVGDLKLPRGALTYGYFWKGRPYTVYHWVRADGRTLGFYVNLADQVRIRPGAVEWRDLALDLLFSPDGRRVQALDEDQLAQLPAALRAKAESARADVLTHRDEVVQEVAALTAHLRGRRRVPG
jgi:protein associated with RNAse G/E